MRTAGILLHISSLPDPYGIGTLGKEAYKFIDFLKASGCSYWQMLPVGPTGYGDSPYQSYSAFAGNPNLIDLATLVADGLLSEDDLPEATEFDDYEELFNAKSKLLHTAYLNFTGDLTGFATENPWLEDYALYMKIKYSHDMHMWTMWEDPLRLREPEAIAAVIKEDSENPSAEYSIGFWKFCQYIFYKQFAALKAYAAKNRIKLIGDMPIYVSTDSSDIWANPELFELDTDLRPVNVAGCPPDDYAKTGQLWGNPVYAWGEHLRTGYRWWISRIMQAGKLFDVLRIDHFRGFESFYAIPADAETAENGVWKTGPGAHMFDVIRENCPDAPEFIAENLGFLTDDVKKMLDDVGYPGMNVLEFAFGGDDSCYLPHNFIKNSVSYIGTHDNDTALGWYNSQNKKTKKRVRKYICKSSGESICEALIRTLAASVSDMVIFQMQDLLELDSEARMNTPSTVGSSNWHWRLSSSDYAKKTTERLRKILERYFRIPPPVKVKPILKRK
ncbi:MAG: 4-alpha-glucanotransferase [Ruminococcus sp.]|jgi:4-alpha-glucanotransferase|nr:4-alpha-glucanotransferase [Ruminococcus sp.]